MTFSELQTDALSALNSTATDVRTRIKASINKWQRQLLTRPGFVRLLRDRQLTFASVANTATVTFPSTVQRINGITDTTNDRPLVRRDLSWVRRQDPGLTAVGQPEVYVQLGRSSSGLLQVQLWPTPQSASSYILDHTTSIVDLSADEDIPLLPEDYHYVLSLGAQHDEWRRRDDSRASSVRDEMEIGLRSLNNFLWDTADAIDEAGTYGVNRLGGWFPAQRWR